MQTKAKTKINFALIVDTNKDNHKKWDNKFGYVTDDSSVHILQKLVCIKYHTIWWLVTMLKSNHKVGTTTQLRDLANWTEVETVYQNNTALWALIC